MRIISQNCTIDIPYNHVVVYIHNTLLNQIYVKMYVSGVDYSSDGFSIGKYHNREDAKYVMSRIREAAIFGQMYFYMPTAEEASCRGEEGGEEE